MKFEELFLDFVFMLLVIGSGVALFVVVLSLLNPFGLSAGFSLGYSMCKARSVGVDYTSLADQYCAFAPGDVLITAKVWPPKVGDVACFRTDKGIVCHRVSTSSPDRVCVVGDNASWVLCAGEKSYVGKVVAKLPRAFGYPALAVYVMLRGTAAYLFGINAGEYLFV